MACKLITLAPLTLTGSAQRLFSDAEISALDNGQHVVSLEIESPSTNSADTNRLGDANVSSTRGVRVPKGDFRTIEGDGAAAGGAGLLALEALYVIGTGADVIIRNVTVRTY
jgi:hypothetical protein